MISFAFDSLSIHIEADGFSVFKRKEDLVIRKSKRLESIRYESSKKIAEEIVNLIKDKEFSSLRTIKLIFSNKLFTLIPEEFYDEDKASTYIEFNHFLLPDEPIETQCIHDLKIRFLFSYDESIEREIKKSASKTNIIITHSGQQLISFLHRLVPEKKYFIYFNTTSIELIFFNEEQLIFYNYFEVKTKEDVLYYLLFVAQQLDIDINQALICLLGDITLWQKAIEMMKKYVRYVDISLNDDPVVKENLF